VGVAQMVLDQRKYGDDADFSKVEPSWTLSWLITNHNSSNANFQSQTQVADT
jgi:hypothetical protein